MVINWPVELISDLARRRTVLVLGSGISANSQNIHGVRPKTWSSFLLAAISTMGGSKARRDAVTKLVRTGDYLTACRVIRDAVGAATFHTFTENEFLTPGFQAAPRDMSISCVSRG
jgi:hypothetical protein